MLFLSKKIILVLPEMSFRVGTGSFIIELSVATNPFDGEVNIGSYTSVAREVVFLTGRSANHACVDHPDAVTTFPMHEILDMEEFYPNGNAPSINIGNDVWIGCRAIILPGVTIGNGAIVGAGCVVSKDVPPYAVVVGNPMKIVRYRFEQEDIDSLEKIAWWNWPVEKLKGLAADFKDIKTFIRKHYTSPRT